MICPQCGCDFAKCRPVCPECGCPAEEQGIRLSDTAWEEACTRPSKGAVNPFAAAACPECGPSAPAEDEVSIERGYCRLAFIQGKGDASADSATVLKMLHGMDGGMVYSFPTFFLGPIYWVYRKCYLPALALMAICCAVGLACSLMGMQVRMARSLPGIIGGAYFYRIYRWQADRVFEKGRNRGLRGAELEEYMREQGGVSWFAAGVAAVAFVLLGLAVMVPQIAAMVAAG